MIGDFLILRIVILVLFLTKKAIVIFYFQVQNRRVICVVVITCRFLWRSVVAQIFLLIFFYFRPCFDSLGFKILFVVIFP